MDAATLYPAYASVPCWKPRANPTAESNLTRRFSHLTRASLRGPLLPDSMVRS